MFISKHVVQHMSLIKSLNSIDSILNSVLESYDYAKFKNIIKTSEESLQNVNSKDEDGVFEQPAAIIIDCFVSKILINLQNYYTKYQFDKKEKELKQNISQVLLSILC